LVSTFSTFQHLVILFGLVTLVTEKCQVLKILTSILQVI
jgi:hypothetical protein